MVEFWMPLNKYKSCPDCVAGAGGTTQFVENKDMGLPVLLVHDAYVTQPLADAGGRSLGKTTLCGITGRPGGRLGITPKSCRTCPDGCSLRSRPPPPSSIAPGSTWKTSDLGRRPPGVSTWSSAMYIPP